MSAILFLGDSMQCHACGVRKTSPAVKLTIETHPDGRLFGCVSYCANCNPRRDYYLARDAAFQKLWDAALAVRA